MSVEDLEKLVLLLGRWDGGSGPLYRQLAAAVRRLLELGRYEPGDVLPPERQLAKALAVSRNTVVAAYGELRDEGWVQAKRGSATTVATAMHMPAASHQESGLFASIMRSDTDVVDFTIAAPQIAPAAVDALHNPGSFVDLDRQLEGHGLHVYGLPDLREAIAGMLCSEGMPTKPEELLLTTGAQHAISLVTRALLRPGDTMAIDEISYPGALDAVAAANGVVTPVRFGPEGTDTSDLRRVIEEEHPRIVYTIPTFHNPTGVLTGGKARGEAISVLAEAGVTVLEDFTLASLGHSVVGTIPPPLTVLAADASVITVGSLSKVFWSGLRVGWIRAREPMIARLASHKVSHDLAASVPSQLIGLAVLRRYEETKAWRNQQLRNSLETLGNGVDEHLGDWCWTPPVGGPYAWFELPTTDARAFAQVALRRGVALIPGSLVSARSGTGENCVRLPLYPSPEELAAGLAKLGGIWHDFREGQNSR